VFSEIIDRTLKRASKFTEDVDLLNRHLLALVEKNHSLQKLVPFVKNRGKYVRSILYFDFWNNANYAIEEKKYKTIALIELLHLASMMHDDVIDNNYNRRSNDSFMKRYGSKESILLGDFVFAKVVNEFLILHDSESLVKNLFLRECSATAYGVVLERQLTYASTFSEYLRVAMLKTSPLFKLCCFLGAYLSTKNFVIAKRAAIFGICFGVIFQIQNDISCYNFEDFKDSEDYVQKNITLPAVILRDHFDYDISKFEQSDQIHYEEMRKMIFSSKFTLKVTQHLNKFIRYIDSF
jgi:geranylgeranyl pyrophosphate synthase